MPFVVIAKKQRGKFTVNPCPSCGKQHRHSEAGTVKARCGMVYAILAVPAPPKHRGRR
jgi:hypothetical protein